MAIGTKNVRFKYNIWQRINRVYHKNCDALLWCKSLFSQPLSAKITSHDDTAQSEFLSSRVNESPGGVLFYSVPLYTIFACWSAPTCGDQTLHLTFGTFFIEMFRAPRIYTYAFGRLTKCKREEAFKINIKDSLIIPSSSVVMQSVKFLQISRVEIHKLICDAYIYLLY